VKEEIASAKIDILEFVKTGSDSMLIKLLLNFLLSSSYFKFLTFKFAISQYFVSIFYISVKS